MKFQNETAELFIPDGVPEAEALSRVTHLGVGAHQDDLEVMASHGIIRCFGAADRWFGGVTCTNGAGSARAGAYADFSDEQMVAVRRVEQRKAAILGEYAAMAQLDYPSAVVRDPANTTLKEDLIRLLEATRPEFVYTHNPADKHLTHVAVVVTLLEAVRELPRDSRPGKIYGCETWRNLDWMQDQDKVRLDVGDRPNLAAALIGIFDSQISGGKRYDTAALGRWRSNATFFESHGVDAAEALTYAMDLTPLAADDPPDLVEYVLGYIDEFREDVRMKLSARLGRGAQS